MVVLFRRPIPADEPAGALAVTPLRIENVIRDRLVSAEFQPVVHLDSGDVVGYEALARGPAGTVFESPRMMYAAAAEVAMTAELDAVAHAAALRAAAEAHLDPGTALFLNVAGAAVDVDIPGALDPTRPRVYLEISERALALDLRSALSGAARARPAGLGVALDNIGVSAVSLALLPLIHPDVVKIDISLVQDRAHPHAARVMNAITAHAERTGTSIMAVGIETDTHLRTARALGAVLGQGFGLSRPAALPHHPTTSGHRLAAIAPHPPVAPQATPYQLATVHTPGLLGGVAPVAAHLEQRAGLDPDPMVVLACLPDNQMISGAPLAVLQMLARNASFIGALVGDVPVRPIPDIQWVPLASADPLRAEPALVLLGPHYAALLAAHGDRYRLVYERPVVEQAAQVLLRKLHRPA